jgi:anti-sigma factor ChrR (cupin superfamily)
MTERKKTTTDIIDNALAGTLAEALTPIAPPIERAGELKSRVMARIRGKKSFDLMTVRADEGTWIKLLPGVEKKILHESANGERQSYLLRMAPGSIIPPHIHIHHEESIMLEGEVKVGKTHLSAGDYHFARKGSLHGLARTKIGCLVFVKTYDATVDHI